MLLAGISILRTVVSSWLDGDMGSARAQLQYYYAQFANMESAIGVGATVFTFTVMSYFLLHQGFKQMLFSWLIALGLYFAFSTTFTPLVEDRMKPEMIILIGQAAVIFVNVCYQLAPDLELISSLMAIVLTVWVLIMMGAKFYYKLLSRFVEKVCPPPDIDDMKSYESAYDRAIRKVFPSRLRWVPNLLMYVAFVFLIIGLIKSTLIWTITICVVASYAVYYAWSQKTLIIMKWQFWYNYDLKTRMRKIFAVGRIRDWCVPRMEAGPPSRVL